MNDAIRWTEWRLLSGVLVLMGLAVGETAVRGVLPEGMLLRGGVLAGLVVIPPIVWGISRARMSETLYPAIAFLMLLGWFMQERLTGLLREQPQDVSTLAPWLLVFSIIMLNSIFSWRGGIQGLLRWYPVFLIGSVMISVGLWVMGQPFMGSFYGPGYTTPSEISKILLIVALAGWVGAGESCFSRVAMSAGLLLQGILFILLRDIGSLATLGVLFIVSRYVLSRSFVLLGGSTAAVIAGGYVLHRTVGYASRRIDSWLAPFEHADQGGFQLLQSLFALSAGGLWGSGIGAGEPERVPVVLTDFLGAAMAEELGLLGMLAVLACFMGIVQVLLVNAVTLEDRSEACFLILVAGYLGFQVALNLGGVSGLLPITGVTLPLLSKGGTSLVCFGVLLGLAMGLTEAPADDGTKPDFHQD